MWLLSSLGMAMEWYWCGVGVVSVDLGHMEREDV